MQAIEYGYEQNLHYRNPEAFKLHVRNTRVTKVTKYNTSVKYTYLMLFWNVSSQNILKNHDKVII